MYHFRKRSDKYRDIFPQNVAILSDLFSQVLAGQYGNFLEVGMKKFSFGEDLLGFTHGKKIQKGKSWRKCKALYMPLNVRECHWVALVADLVKCELVVLDADIAVNTTKQMEEAVRLFYALLPLLLRDSKQFKSLGKKLDSKWS